MPRVVIAGGGPTGLMLAGELALAGADVAIVERRASQALDGARSRGLQARTIEVLDQRGIADRFLAVGTVAQVAGFSGIRLDISDFPSRHPYGLALLQDRFEEILAGWIEELKVPIYREQEVTGFTQDDGGVDVGLADGAPLRAEYLVGCDGGRSVIRRTAGIEFPGWDPSISSLIAEVDMDEEPEWGVRRDENGTHALGQLEDGQRVGVVVSERYTGQAGDPTLEDLSRALVAVRGTDFGVHSADLDLPVHRHDPAGGVLPEGPGAAGRRRRARALAGRRAGPQHRRAGRGEPGLEAGPGGRRDITGRPAGHLPGRAAPGRGARAAQHHGANRAHPVATRASTRCATSCPSCWAWTSRAGGSAR